MMNERATESRTKPALVTPVGATNETAIEGHMKPALCTNTWSCHEEWMKGRFKTLEMILLR